MSKDRDLSRYSRQIPLLREDGQERLFASHVFIAGAGGLGSAAAFYMAAAGFGRITIVDGDSVETSNLNRQILHGMKDLGRSKASSACESMRELNPEVEVEPICATIEADNIDELLGDAELIVDALDSFDARFLLNRAAIERGIPLFHGAISGFRGQATTVIPGRTACIRCIYPRHPPSTTPPALGSTCGIIGSIQVNEAVKYVGGKGCLLENRLAIWDGLASVLEEVEVDRDLHCPDCGPSRRR